MAPRRPQSAPTLPSCLEGPQGRVSWECPPSQCCSDRSQGLGGDPGAWGLCRVQARLCALIPSPLFLSQGFQGKTGPPGPPGVVGPQVRLPPTPRRDKASQTFPKVCVITQKENQEKGSEKRWEAQGLIPGSSFLSAVSLSQTCPSWDKSHETF